MKKSLKTLLGTVLTGVALVAGGLVTASPAAAAGTPACDTVVHQGIDNYHHSVVPYSKGARAWFDCKLKSGYDRVAVRPLQVALNRCYGKGLETDGVFGPATYRALVSVQKKVGVTADGVYGPKTRRAMKWPIYNSFTNKFNHCHTT